MRHYTLFLVYTILVVPIFSRAQVVNEVFEGQDTFFVLPADLHYTAFTAYPNSIDKDFPEGRYRQYLYTDKQGDTNENATPIGYYEFHLQNNLLEKRFAHLMSSGYVLSEGEYVQGKKHGYWQEYQEKGGLLRSNTYYEYGTNMQMFFYNEEGLLLRRDIHFLEIDLTEKVITTWFYPSGNLSRQGVTIVNIAGKQVVQKEGQWRTWYPDGSPRAIEYYEGGEYSGTCRYFRKDGQLKSISVFRKGKLKEEIEYHYPEESTENILALYKNKNGKVLRSVEL